MNSNLVFSVPEPRVYIHKNQFTKKEKRNQVVQFGPDIWWSNTYDAWYCRIYHSEDAKAEVELMRRFATEAEWKAHLLECHNCVPPDMPGAPYWPLD